MERQREVKARQAASHDKMEAASNAEARGVSRTVLESQIDTEQVDGQRNWDAGREDGWCKIGAERAFGRNPSRSET